MIANGPDKTASALFGYMRASRTRWVARRFLGLLAREGNRTRRYSRCKLGNRTATWGKGSLFVDHCYGSGITWTDRPLSSARLGTKQASGGNDRTVRIWKVHAVEKGKTQKIFERHTLQPSAWSKVPGGISDIAKKLRNGRARIKDLSRTPPAGSLSPPRDNPPFVTQSSGAVDLRRSRYMSV
jgi:hypothetical protein